GSALPAHEAHEQPEWARGERLGGVPQLRHGEGHQGRPPVGAPAVVRVPEVLLPACWVYQPIFHAGFSALMIRRSSGLVGRSPPAVRGFILAASASRPSAMW